MFVDFCPKCGKMLLSEKNTKGETIKICPKCGFKHELSENENADFTEEIVHDSDIESLPIIDESKVDSTKPKEDMYCANCKKIQKVSFWMIQTRSADESPTRFFRCSECGETWREYD